MSKILVGTMMALLITGIATPVFAQDGQENSSTSVRDNLNEVKSQTEQKMNEARVKAETAREQLDQTRENVKDVIKSQKEQIEQRRNELRQQIDASRLERKTELTNKRLELCQQRQGKINELIAGSAKFGRERLTNIQKIEANVKGFYERKALVSTEYDAAVSMVDEKEASAIAAVEATENQKFDCTKVDGDKPSGEIQALHQAKFTALNDYRDGVKQLIQIVKAAAQQAKNADGSAS